MAGSVKRIARRAVMLAGFVLLSACYHTITTTTLSPGPQHVEPWAIGFVYGLVPAKVDAQAMCHGKPIQAVDTQASFLNMLVGWVTGGIVTPMTVTVTCAG